MTRAEAPRQVRAVWRHARRTALIATLVAGVVYLAAVAVADFVVLSHLQTNIDARLATRAGEITATLPKSGVPRVSGPIPSGAVASSSAIGDPDDAPIFSWWAPTGAARTLPLQINDPALGAAPAVERGLANETIAGHPFRLDVRSLAKGRLVVGTSVAQFHDLRATLLVLEGALLPVLLVMFFLFALVIGRGAAAPIERARQEQLEFTADASHELRTPLAVIEAEVGLALSSDRPAAQYRASLERVAGESRRLRGIVDDLLWLARLEALPETPQHGLVDLAPLLRIAESRFSPIAAKRGISLRFSAAREPALVHAPAEWLDRLLSVLVDNACRYADEGGRIALAVEVKDGRTVLTVDDSGPGIDPEARDEVTRRFHRASTLPGGAGLGLSIADTIVRSTAGRWRIVRAPIGGTRVEVSWPFPRREGTISAGDEAPASGEAGTGEGVTEQRTSA